MRIKGLPIVRSGAFYRADSLVQEDGTLGEMFVRFSPFDTWYEINSMWEGRFLERTVPGAFKNTINAAKRSDGLFSTKVLFNHGMDLNIGDKMLGVPRAFAEVKQDGYHGPQLDVPLADTSYNRDLAPLIRAGAYGSSFMFESIREDWNNEPEQSDHNPEGLPERTISEARVFEGGPVTWPASPTASAGMRSLAGTDQFVELLHSRDAGRYDTLVRSYEAFRAMRHTPDYREFTPTPPVDETERRQVEQEMSRRELKLRQAKLALMRR
jgi:phage head maturation protease